jgi:predicted transglutaminase-like cysteine proteinase
VGSVLVKVTVSYAVELIHLDKFVAFVSARYTPDVVVVARQYRQFLTEHTQHTELEKVFAVNDFFHQHITYITDLELYGESDYWATPAELIGAGKGDCEDWAIAKYLSLRHLNIDESKLRLVYVRARIGAIGSPVSQAHMVLAYYPTQESEPLILDSLIRTVLPASQRDDLTPVFSFNAEGLWAGQSDQRSSQSPRARLSRWRALLDRLPNEGIVL